MIAKNIQDLVLYGLTKGLVNPEDKIFTTNALLELFELDELEDTEQDASSVNGSKSGDYQLPGSFCLEETLKEMMDYAYEKGIMKEDSIVYRDLFDTKIMSKLMPRPSEVIEKFNTLYKNSPQTATDFYYRLSQDSDYIRRYRIERDVKWVTKTEYGNLDITINLSKPEKDPKAIAAAKLAKQSGYPKCLNLMVRYLSSCIDNLFYSKSNTISKVKDIAFFPFHKVFHSK
ncbi:MAG TPA: hypothetical protein VHQ24_03290, partial [Lachnospiraceae bacterium]|nr:hypothetical protein [Lachnospiraceae bacterium]